MKKKIIFHVISLLIFSLFFSCAHINDANLEKVLAKSGENRVELEKVLQHYRVSSKDSLKYRAAVFLIDNMEDQFFFTGNQYSYFLNFADSISDGGISAEGYKSALDSFYQKNKTLVGSLIKKFDVNNIKADYLIRNIDEAFLAYETAPWHKEVSFEDFCEYILPYRIGNEPLEDLRSSFYNQYKPLLSGDTLTIQKAADSVLKVISLKKTEIITFPDYVPDFPISSLLKIRGGTCRESSGMGIYILRSLGIPVAGDYTPQWPHRGRGHSWSALLINKDSCIDFEGATSDKVGDHLKLSNVNRMAKAYRHTYSKQINSLALQHGEEPIPDFFKNPHLKDVSAYYFKGVDIQVDIRDNARNKYAYICVFDNKNWTPIHWGSIVNNVVIFSGMGKPVVYLPALYQDNQLVPVGDPILVDSTGKSQSLIPNEKVLQTLSLKRKYPVFDWWNTRMEVMKGGRFQAANKADFSDAVTLYEITSLPEMTYQTVEIKVDRGYKYWRYLARDSTYGEIAELEFYDENGKGVTGKIIGARPSEKACDKQSAFDGNPLTFFQGENRRNKNWVGLSFAVPQHIKIIRYLCHNDDNFIKRGEQYELYYWKDKQWKLLGKKTGDNSQVLVFANAPTNALFLLHNNSKGREERIFTFDNGRQMWW